MARIYISDLKPADEIQAWVKLGFALKKGRNPDGSLFRFVPNKPMRADPDDLTRFTGWVVSNDPDSRTLLLHVQKNDSHGTPVSRESLQAAVSYSIFQRVRKFSDVAFEPREQSLTRPTGKAIGTAFKAYRIVEEVVLR